MVAGKFSSRSSLIKNSWIFCLNKLYGQVSRAISTGWLNPSPDLHFQPINLVVYKDPLALERVGDLILGQASRLYAFSGYPSRT
jgi:hypothetical protein